MKNPGNLKIPAKNKESLKLSEKILKFSKLPRKNTWKFKTPGKLLKFTIPLTIKEYAIKNTGDFKKPEKFKEI